MIVHAIRRWRRVLVTAVAGLLVSIAAPAAATAHTTAPPRAACELTAADSAWIATALSGWKRVSDRSLRVPAIRFPILVLFDSLCSHRLDPVTGAHESAQRFSAAGQAFALESAEHGGTIRLPDGDSVPARLVSFASRLRNGDMFFVMSLPVVWSASGRGPRSDALASAVFMHEFTHTQSPALGSRVDALIRRGLPESSDDDIIQKRFDSLPDFRRAYERERDLLFEAAAAPTRARAVAAARRALALADRRRARFFRGANAIYAETEDVFLSMEGTGQWAAYLWLVDPEGGAMRPDEALPFMRRGGRRWSQDEGLALLLVLGRLDPIAPRELFGSNPSTILTLLRRSLRSGA